MQRPLSDVRPIGPFNQLLPSDDTFELEFILDEDTIIQKSPVQSDGRINIDQQQAIDANANAGDILQVRIFPSDSKDNILEAAESGDVQKLFGTQPQALFGARVQEEERINIPEATQEMLGLDNGDTVVLIGRKANE